MDRLCTASCSCAVQHEMLSTSSQRRRLPGQRQRRTNASKFLVIAFWALASALCLVVLCLISFHVSSSNLHVAHVRSAALASGPTAASQSASKLQKDFGVNSVDKLKINGISSTAIRVQCTITTPHSARSSAEVANGKFHITVRPDLAPQSSAAFVQLVRSNYYNSGVYFHRVIKGFIAQAGINPNYRDKRPPTPKETTPDLPSSKSLSNVRGTVSFAGGNMHLGQIFINLGNNRRLDVENNDDGSTRPFGTVDDADEMANVFDKLYTSYKEGSGQVKAVKSDDVASQFPDMSRIEECHVVG